MKNYSKQNANHSYEYHKKVDSLLQLSLQDTFSANLFTDLLSPSLSNCDIWRKIDRRIDRSTAKISGQYL